MVVSINLENRLWKELFRTTTNRWKSLGGKKTRGGLIDQVAFWEWVQKKAETREEGHTGCSSLLYQNQTFHYFFRFRCPPGIWLKFIRPVLGSGLDCLFKNGLEEDRRRTMPARGVGKYENQP